MQKTDLKKELKTFYNPPKKEPVLVDVPEFQFLMIDGMDARPESPVFQESIQTLFGVSYKLKFSLKTTKKVDYVVMPLEGLWWADDMSHFEKGNKEKWSWTLMIMQPDFVAPDDLSAAIEIVRKKTPSDLLDKLRLEKLTEGLSGQIMHIGPFSEEHANIQKIHNLIKGHGGSFNGLVQKHHEIYLSDFRRVAPEKMKTVIRQPFVK